MVPLVALILRRFRGRREQGARGGCRASAKRWAQHLLAHSRPQCLSRQFCCAHCLARTACVDLRAFNAHALSRVGVN